MSLKINQLHPDVMGVCINLNVFPWNNSAARLYMCGNMIPKSVVTVGRTTRKIIAGFEKQYGETARKIAAPANMTVEQVFFIESLQGNGLVTDEWNSIWVVFKNDEKNAYDVLELPRYNTQNTYIGFEYVYDKEMIRRLFEEKNPTFRKGDVFGRSPRISESGEWQFGMETKVAAMSSHRTEEDGIVITESYARNRMRCMFKHEREFNWDEEEYVPVFLYGTDENPRPFPESGEPIRPDGLVMAFRKRVTENALVSLTKKALRTPDYLYDILFYAPAGSKVMSIEVSSDRMKNQSNNRSTEYIDQEHNRMLTLMEKAANEHFMRIISWYETKNRQNGNVEIPVTFELDTFIRNAYYNYTVDFRGQTKQINPLYRAFKRTRKKDWNVKILLKEEVVGRSKFKLSGMNGDKGVAVTVIPDDHAPMYEDGTRAEIIINNTPAFRRQIFGMLMEMSINFINMNVHREMCALREQGDYKGAWQKLIDFYYAANPEFGELVDSVYVTDEERFEHVDYVAKDQISIQYRSDSKVVGADIINALRAKYSYKPQRAYFVNALGERVLSENPILITSMYYMLLDKFGTDMSSQAMPKSNLFGMPAKLNEQDKYGNWYRDIWNRNSGETESRLRNSQSGTQEIVKNLALAYSPDLRRAVASRIIRAEDPFEIKQIVKVEEYETNAAVIMGGSMLSDSGYTIRHERPSDRSNHIGE